VARRRSDATRTQEEPGEARRPAWRDDGRVRIGISSCLLGQRVRWDGGHKHAAVLMEQLAPFVEWVSVCPEVELGMGVPREPIRLVEREDDEPDAGPRLLAERSGRDWTRAMHAWSRRRVRALRALDLSGYVLKTGSPSCGMERVRVWNAAGRAERRGRGLFARTLLEAFPLLPVEEEGRLADPRLRAHWIERVFAFRRLRALFAGGWTRGDLAAFHAAHEVQLRAHSPRRCAALGRLVTGAAQLERTALRRHYCEGFMEALRAPATPRRRQIRV
jgi:uncharacterized protein YbbK (DUF523 family)